MADYDWAGHGRPLGRAMPGCRGTVGREGLILVCQKDQGSQGWHRPVILVYVVYSGTECYTVQRQAGRQAGRYYANRKELFVCDIVYQRPMVKEHRTVCAPFV